MKKKTEFILLAAILVSICFAVFFVLGRPVLAQYGEEIIGGVNVPKVELVMSIIKVINWVLGFLALIAIILIIYAGFIWMTAGGDAKKVDKAKKILVNALIGLIIIILSGVITLYVFRVLEEKIGGGGGFGQPCSPADSCVACDVFCNAEGKTEPNTTLCHTDSLCGILPQNIFKIESIVTSCGNPPQYNQDVYLCSAVVINFNHQVSSGSVEPAVNNDSLKIEKCNSPDCSSATLLDDKFSGSSPTKVGNEWTVNGRSITFNHEVLLEKNQKYRLTIPKTITDVTGLSLTDPDDPDEDCGSGLSPIPGCVDAGTEYRWTFETGVTVDNIPPEVTGTYPRNQADAGYPDRNVNLKPVIWARFSEPILPSSVNKNNIKIRKVTGVNLTDVDGSGTLGPYLPENSYNVGINSSGNGFEVYDLLLEKFAWYQIEVSGILDLCNNSMVGLKKWRFETNDTAPGVRTIYPANDYKYACPNTSVFIIFNTSMYNSANNSCAVLSANGGYVTGGSFSPSVAGKTLTVVDNYPGQPADPNDYCKGYEFLTPVGSISFNVNETYHIGITTNMIMNKDGDILNYGDIPPLSSGTLSQGPWHFTVKPANECANAPVITNVSPNHGSDGTCLTIFGRYFDPDDNGKGNADKATFNGQELTVDGTAWTDKQIATSIPSPTNLPKDTKYPLQVFVEHGGVIGTLASNLANFTLENGAASNGPCLWSIAPSKGCTADKASLNGIRFGPDPGAGNRSTATNHVDFFDVPDTTIQVSENEVNSWSQTKISVNVPANVDDGPVTLTAGGKLSNPVNFDMSCSGPVNCSTSATMCLPSNTICAPGYECNTGTCRCQAIITPGVQYLQVITSSVCNLASVPPVLPSPNPKSGAENVCLNAQVALQFDEKIDGGAASLNENTFQMEKCTLLEVVQKKNGLAVALAVASSNDKCKQWEKVAGARSVFETANGGGILFAPTNNFQEGTLYRAKVTVGLLSLSGKHLQSEYSWRFTATIPFLGETGTCPVAAVLLEPTSALLNYLGATQNYLAVPVASQENGCALLSGNYIWSWNSTNPAVASLVDNVTMDKNTAVARAEGTTVISATTQNKTGRSNLRVALGACSSDADCNACPGSVCDRAKQFCTPAVNSLNPASGPKGRWVTIEGCYFGASRGDGYVEFADQKLKDAKYYPCAKSWSDNEIIFEVPDRAGSGNQAVHVTNNNLLVSQNFLDFNLTQTCGVLSANDKAPGLCRLNPSYGQEGALINFEGNNFTGNPLDNNGQIFFNDGGLAATQWSSWATTTVRDVQVPAGVASGLANVSVKSCPSNALYFGAVGTSCDGDIGQSQCQPNQGMCGRGLVCEPSSCACQPPGPPEPLLPPRVVSTIPNNKDTNICRNTLISVTFDQVMNKGSLANNIILEGYSPNGCAIASLPNNSNFLKKTFNKIINFIRISRAQGNNWCPVQSKISAYEINNICNISVICDQAVGCECQVGGRKVCLIAQNESSCNYQVSQVNLSPNELLGNKICSISTYCNRPNGCDCEVAAEKVCTISYGDGKNTRCNYPTQYKVTVKGGGGGVKSLAGAAMTADYLWDFTTGQEICSIDKVKVEPTTYVFTRSGQTRDFRAAALSKNGVELTPIPGAYNWTWGWSKVDNNTIVNLASQNNLATLTANNVNGQATLKATASITEDIVNHTEGKEYFGYATIFNRLCVNPWPANGQPYGDNDSYANFSLFYCRDKGGSGTSDDLPALDETPSTQRFSPAKEPEKMLKEYLFLRADGSTDAIGIRIFTNQENLSPLAWYNSRDWLAKGAPSSLKVDGYEAIRDGRSVYVAATTLSGGTLYTNIYLISYNENASAGTIEIYNNLLKSWTFNINVTDKRVCSTSPVYCTVDSKCPVGEKCEADKSKLIRDTKRITDLGALARNLKVYKGGYCQADFKKDCADDSGCPTPDTPDDKCVLNHGYYPKLLAGSYEIGHSTSKWPSWQQTLGAELGKSLPVDPINEFPKVCEIGGKKCQSDNDCQEGPCVVNSCPLPDFDQASCWNETTKTFVCPPGSYLYQYQATDVGQTYHLYANMEYEGSGAWGQVGDDTCEDYIIDDKGVRSVK